MIRRNSFLKVVFVSLCGCAITLQAVAQSQKKTKSRGSSYDTGSSYDAVPINKNEKSKSHLLPADTTDLPDNSAYGNTGNNSTGQVMPNLPIEVVKDSTDGGLPVS